VELPKLTRRAKEREKAAREVAEAPMTRLEERREQLRERFAELQWDLGGAAYEMAARDYFRLDVLARMAARLQTVDAELAEIERMARLERAGASGSCPGCGSLYAQGAVYCWRCGRNIHATGNDVVGSAPAVPAQTAPANGFASDQRATQDAPLSHGSPYPSSTRVHGGGSEGLSAVPGEVTDYPDQFQPAPDVIPQEEFDPGAPVRDAFVEMDLGPPGPEGHHGGQEPPPEGGS